MPSATADQPGQHGAAQASAGGQNEIQAYEQKTSYSSSTKVTVLQTSHSEMRSVCESELGARSDAVGQHTCQSFLDWAAAERLRDMPHDGGRWDQVLKWAEYFALQTYNFSESTRYFLVGVDQAESLALGTCLQLLRLGPSRAHILTVVFGVLYEMSLNLDFYTRVDMLLNGSSEVKQLVGQAYGDVLTFLVRTGVYYTRSRAQDVAEFESHFGQIVQTFFARKASSVDILWSVQLQMLASEVGNTSITIEDIRAFVSPQDVTLAATKAGLRSTRRDRSERTCTWFNKHLRDFNVSSDKVLHINGKAGSGKTYLAAWVEEKLRGNSGVHAYDTIAYFINPDFRQDGSVTTVVKGLLAQAFEFNIGNATLWNAVCDAYMAFERGATAEEVDRLLWHALEVALAGAGKVMVIVDGLDHLADQPTDAVHLLEHLGKATRSAPHAKSIVLSGPLSKPSPVAVRTFNLDATLIEEDIYYYVGSVLATTAHFRALSVQDRHTIQHKLSKTSQGSFVWADLALTLLRKQSTLRGVLQEVDSLPKSIGGLIDVHVANLNITSSDTRALLAWMVAAERPLRIPEVKALFEVDAVNVTHTPRLTQVEDDIDKALEGLVIQQAGIVRFRHTVVREYIADLARDVKDFKNSATAKFPFNIQEAHYDLTTRALAYIKIHLTRYGEPTSEPVNPNFVTELFKDHELLEYTTRYWVTHFMASPMFQPNGDHKLTGTIKKVMPESTLLAWIETSLFRFSTSITETFTKQRTVYDVRRLTLDPNAPAVLQSLFALATIHQITLKRTDVNEYFYQAYQIAKTVLEKHSMFTAICATRYVDTVTMAFTSRTDFAKRKETMLVDIVDTFKTIQGVSSDLTVKYLDVLADFYVQIQDIEKSLTVQQELYEVYIQKYGQLDTRTTSMYQRVIKTMEKTSKSSAEVTKIHTSNWQVAQRSLAASDDRRITVTRDMAKMYESQQNTTKAEELYVDSWRNVTREARTSKNTAVRRKAIHSTLEYVRFLRRQKRTEEASSILQGLSSDLKVDSTSTEQTSEEEMTAVREVGEEMKTMNLNQAAQNVFSKVWGWYKHTGKTNTKEASSVATSYAETVKETSSTQDETFLREVLASTSQTSNTTSHTSSLRIVTSLQNTYASQSRWSEAIKISEEGLTTQWKGILSSDKTIKMPTENRETLITLTRKLASYYLEVSMVEQAEKIHVNLFQAAKNSLDVTSAQFTEIQRELIAFYENTYQHEKVYHVYQDLITLHSTRLGRTHTTTITAMYHLADLYSSQRRTRDAETSYFAIYRSFGEKQDQPLDKIAVKAAEELCRIYEIERRWDDAQKVYFRLQQTILKSKASTYTAEFVNKVNTRYLHLLKHELRAEHSVVRQAAVTYRKTCLDVFGTESEAYISASLQVAQLDEEHEQTRAEAMKIYEEVYRKSQSTNSSWGLSTLTMISNAKHKLAHLFSKHDVHNDLSVTLYREEFESTRSQRGLGHHETMSWLTYWVNSTSKQNTVESKTRTHAVLKATLEQIITTETNTEHLHTASSKLASLYLTAGLKTEGQTFVQQTRERAVFSETSTRDRRLYVFIAAFESTLIGGAFSEIMADLMTEVLHYDTYRSDVTKKVHYHVTFVSGARLLLFLRAKQRTQESQRIEKELREALVSGLGETATQNPVILTQFFQILVGAVEENEHSLVIIYSGAAAVHQHLEAGKFEEAYLLTLLIERFTRDSSTNVWASNQGIATGLKLSMYLAGQGIKPASDEKLCARLLDLSRTILRQTLSAMRQINAKLTQFPIRELDQLAVVLGSQQNFEDLEWLLSMLWSSRHSQSSWTPGTVVDIGRRLADCRFSRNNIESATHLAVDIYYNLRRVWGAFDGTTLETAALLSSLHSSAGNHAAAMALHEDILRMLTDEEADELSPTDAAAIAMRQLAYLQRSYARHGKWEKPATVYQQLYAQLEAALGAEKAWKDANVKPLAQWSNRDADSFGLWTPPRSFAFLAEAGAAERKHSNQLKRLSRFSHGNGSSSPASSTASLNQTFHVGARVNGSVAASSGAATQQTTTVPVAIPTVAATSS